MDAMSRTVYLDPSSIKPFAADDAAACAHDDDDEGAAITMRISYSIIMH